MFPFKSLWTAVKAADPRRSRPPSDASLCAAWMWRLTEEAHDALGSFKETKGVDASVGDRNVRERLADPDLSIMGLF